MDKLILIVLSLMLPSNIPKDINVFYADSEVAIVDTFMEVAEEVPEVAKSVSSISFHSKSEYTSTGYSLRDNIMIFGLSEYNDFQQRYVIIHEMAHCWAFDILNDNYEEYSEYVEKDNAVISQYSISSIAEDFADAVAYYYIADGFKECFPNRTEYIEKLLEGL